MARDTLLTKWDSVTYLFPPVPLLTKVLHKLRMEKWTKYKMTMIMDPASGVTLDDMVASLVGANHETNLTALQGYHEKVSKAILNFYDGIVKSSVSTFNT